jgi:large subunit ribosomal protein L30
MLRIKLNRSPVGHTERRRRTIIALGLRKIRQVVEQQDTPSIRGMIHHVQDMVSVETFEPEASAPEAKPKAAKAKATEAESQEPASKPKSSRKKDDSTAEGTKE